MKRTFKPNNSININQQENTGTFRNYNNTGSKACRFFREDRVPVCTIYEPFTER